MAEETLTLTVARPAGPTWLATLAEAVDERLASFVATESAALVALDPRLDLLASTARDAVLGGGKRLRPVFAYWGWRACGGQEPTERVLPALSALELLHAFALVHDDVMDRSATRRGRPTAHRALAAAHERSGLTGASERFGDSTAVLVGDLCLVWADRLMAQALVPATALAAARQAYDVMRVEAIAGQFLDVLGEHSPEWTVDRALRVARLKTAGYTVVRPLHFGGALAGRLDSSAAAAFTRYGVSVGEAFQLRDDLLGVFGEPARTGKPAGDDLAQGKPTVLIQLARTAASGPSRIEIDALLDRCRGEAPPDPDQLRRLTELIESTGAPERVREMITERVTAGVEALATAPITDDARSALTSLAYAAAWRSA
ncbi:polyprenyl synthetase family protein [Hamadaea sp. NPDC051192]|uniref:polyprenyl synthetase family protein n=1 Tax=Hamadaea sp. NPDC051192 TaxID=3154940 RepID=UPI0034231C0A